MGAGVCDGEGGGSSELVGGERGHVAGVVAGGGGWLVGNCEGVAMEGVLVIGGGEGVLKSIVGLSVGEVFFSVTIGGSCSTIAGRGLLSWVGGRLEASCWALRTTGMLRSLARVVCFSFFTWFCSQWGWVSGFSCFLSAGFDSLATWFMGLRGQLVVSLLQGARGVDDVSTGVVLAGFWTVLRVTSNQG